MQRLRPHIRHVNTAALAEAGFRVKDVDKVSGVVRTVTDDFMSYPVGSTHPEDAAALAALAAATQEKSQ